MNKTADEQLELAYLAGVMDSDGCFVLTKAKSMSVYTNVPRYSGRMQLAQVTAQIPRMLHERYGGSLTKRKANTKNGLPLHVWVAGTNMAAKAILELLPYLRIKRHEALLLLELKKTMGCPRTDRVNYKAKTRWGELALFTRKALSQEVIEQREKLYQQMKQLKRAS